MKTQMLKSVGIWHSGEMMQSSLSAQQADLGISDNALRFSREK